MGDKITIAEARARRSDPVWLRRHRLADLSGAVLAVLVVVLPGAAGLLWAPLGLVVAAGFLFGAPAGLWWCGPTVGLDRRTALLVAVPFVNLFVLVAAVWRASHLHLQRWQGPVGPPWGDTAWWVLGTAGVAFWLASVVSLGLTLT